MANTRSTNSPAEPGAAVPAEFDRERFGWRLPPANDDPFGAFPEVQRERAQDADFMWRQAWPLQPLSSGPAGTAETKSRMLARILGAHATKSP